MRPRITTMSPICIDSRCFIIWPCGYSLTKLDTVKISVVSERGLRECNTLPVDSRTEYDMLCSREAQDIVGVWKAKNEAVPVQDDGVLSHKWEGLEGLSAEICSPCCFQFLRTTSCGR